MLANGHVLFQYHCKKDLGFFPYKSACEQNKFWAYGITAHILKLHYNVRFTWKQ